MEIVPIFGRNLDICKSKTRPEDVQSIHISLNSMYEQYVWTVLWTAYMWREFEM